MIDAALAFFGIIGAVVVSAIVIPMSFQIANNISRNMSLTNSQSSSNISNTDQKEKVV